MSSAPKCQQYGLCMGPAMAMYACMQGNNSCAWVLYGGSSNGHYGATCERMYDGSNGESLPFPVFAWSSLPFPSFGTQSAERLLAL